MADDTEPGRDSDVERLCEWEHLGSTDGLGDDLQSFGINDLELVDETRGRWNQTRAWLKIVDALRLPAGAAAH